MEASVLTCGVHMATDTKVWAKKYLKNNSSVKRALCIGQIEASTLPPPPPPAYPGRLTPLSFRWGGNQNQSLPGGREF